MLVSVIIPVLNAEKYVANAIYSALEQEGIAEDEREVIVIDDCSSDHTPEVLSRFAHDPAVIILKNEKNLGVAESRNRAIRIARGRYIAFLDADDWWEPDKLSAQLSALASLDAPLCFSARALHEPDGTPTGRIIHAPAAITYEKLLYTNVIPCGSVLARTDLVREFYMSHDNLHEDYILWLQLLRAHGPAVGIDEPYLHTRLSIGGKSRNKLHSARMQYGVYRHLGFSHLRSFFYFCSYAWHGVKKYYR